MAPGAHHVRSPGMVADSERTVRRMSEVVSERLGSSSRFQSGARAVAAGWLTPDDLI